MGTFETDKSYLIIIVNNKTCKVSDVDCLFIATLYKEAGVDNVAVCITASIVGDNSPPVDDVTTINGKSEEEIKLALSLLGGLISNVDKNILFYKGNATSAELKKLYTKWAKQILKP